VKRKKEVKQIPCQNTSTESEKTNRKPNRVNPCTEKTPFKSKYKEGYITPANFLAELIFDKRNEFFNSGKCAERFWTSGNKLHGAYKGQVIAASKLLKIYNADSIIKALKSDEAKFIFKLQDDKLKPIIQKFEDSRVEKTMTESNPEIEQISKPFRSNKRNILKDL
jgi:hypothetical protein